jgi:hypothetical protein
VRWNVTRFHRKCKEISTGIGRLVRHVAATVLEGQDPEAAKFVYEVRTGQASYLFGLDLWLN